MSGACEKHHCKGITAERCYLWFFSLLWEVGVLTGLFVDYYYYYTCFSDPVLLTTFAFVRMRVTDISSFIHSSLQ